MSRKANPTLIGIFVLGAIILGIITILLLAGGEWFQKRSQHILFFEEAAQGLQEGAPVVFLGVKIGDVKNIQLGLSAGDNEFMVPVTIEIEPMIVKSLTGVEVDLQDPATIRKLVERGLRARLKMQNLLTGQQYVDLDFYEDKPARMVSMDPAVSEIPTLPTTFKEIATIMEELPLGAFFADVAAITSSIRKILTTEAISTIPNQLEATLSNLRSLSERIDQTSGSLLNDAKEELAELHKAIIAVQDAMDRVGKAADNIEAWASEDSKIYRGVTKTAEELAVTARKLEELVDEQSPAVKRFNEAMVEIARASRAVRQLADTLEQQPESVIRGKIQRE